MLFCHITSRVQGEKHPNLLSEKGGNGFPFLVYLDAAGEVVAQVNDRSVEGFEKLGSSLSRYQELAKKSDPSKDEKKELWLLGVQIGKFKTGAAAREALKGLAVTDEERAQLEKKLADFDVMEVMRGVRSREAAQAAAAKFAGWAKKGHVPTENQMAVARFWQYVMGHAEQAKDADLYEKGLTVLKAKFGSNPQAAGFFQKAEAKLKAMRAGGGGN